MAIGFPRFARSNQYEKPPRSGFNESLQRLQAPHTSAGNHRDVLLAATLHPAPQAVAPNASIAGWLWLLLALALIVAGGVVLGSRR
jgi:hypothetical protein